MKVQGLGPRLFGEVALGQKVHHLAHGMNTCICAAGRPYAYLLSSNFANGPLQFTLDGRQFGLILEPIVVCTVIFHNEGQLYGWPF
jgi:hypothetical protein